MTEMSVKLGSLPGTQASSGGRARIRSRRQAGRRSRHQALACNGGQLLALSPADASATISIVSAHEMGIELRSSFDR